MATEAHEALVQQVATERKQWADDVELLNEQLENLEAENKRINAERLERGREILRLCEKIQLFEGALAAERAAHAQTKAGR